MTPFGFVYSQFCEFSGRPEHISVADAADILKHFSPIDLIVPSGLTPEEYAEIWNDLVSDLDAWGDPETYWIWHVLLNREHRISPEQLKQAIIMEYSHRVAPDVEEHDVWAMLNRLYAAGIISHDDFLELKIFDKSCRRED